MDSEVRCAELDTVLKLSHEAFRASTRCPDSAIPVATRIFSAFATHGDCSKRVQPATLAVCEHLAPALASARQAHVVTTLLSGASIATGGADAGGPVPSTETIRPSTVSVTAGASLAGARARHTANRLPDGRVVVAGGTDGASSLAAVEVFHSNTWSAARDMRTPRERHTTTLLPSGSLLAVGGWSSTAGHLTSCELFHPPSDLWSTTSPLQTARADHTATLLADGRVLAVGGFDGTSSLASVEVFDPLSATWSSPSSMTAS